MPNRDENRLSRRAWLAAATGAAAGGVALTRLDALAAAPFQDPPVQLPDPTKVPGRFVSELGRRAGGEQPRRLVRTLALSSSSRTPLHELQGTITPSDLHFERHHAGVPEILAGDHELLVHGMVDRPTVFRMRDLRRYPQASRICFVECSGNGGGAYSRTRMPTSVSVQQLDGLLSTSEWTGVMLSTILREAGVKRGASWILAEGADAAVMARSVPLAKAMDDAMLAYGQNGEAEIGEAHEPETHLIPLVLDAATGRRADVAIFGDDYDTPDGTCIRDYVHVEDLAAAHVAALRFMTEQPGFEAINLGNGTGHSVRQIIDAAVRVVGRPVKVRIEGRRPGDPARLVSAIGRAERLLGWRPRRTDLDGQIADAWRWHRRYVGEIEGGRTRQMSVAIGAAPAAPAIARSRPNPFLFIVGCPRSGTTLLQRMLDQHPELAVANDSHFIPVPLRRAKEKTSLPLSADIVNKVRSYRRFHRLRLTDSQIAQAAAGAVTYADFVGALYDQYAMERGKRLGGEKTPDYCKRIALLHGLFPEAKFVHIVRDGRDVALSAMQWANGKKGPGRFHLWQEQPVAVCALWWSKMVAAGRREGARLGPELYREIRYEELVARPDVVLRGVTDFLGLAYAGRMLEFHRGKQRFASSLSAKAAWQPVTAGLRDWRRDMEPRSIALFDALAGDLLADLGYEPAPETIDEKTAALAERCRQEWMLQRRQDPAVAA